MRRWIALLLVLLLGLQGCLRTPGPETGELPGPGDAGEDEVSVVATGLDTVWEIAFAPDGTLFFTERAGRVLTLAPGADEPTLWARVPAEEHAEAGLMGMALDPGFPDEPFIYLCYTREDPAGGGAENVVARYRTTDGQGSLDQVLLDGMDAASLHDGCRLTWDPEGGLLVTMGDATERSTAQDPSSRNGKVLRMHADGRPAGAGGQGWDPAVYTIGHRNPQGMAIHPDTGEVWITEHGPENHDEVNRIQAGLNYGWPEARGPSDGGGAYEPAVWSSGPGGTVAPAGAAFIDAPGSPLHGAFVFATLKAAQLHLFETLDAPPWIGEEHVLFEGDFGRLRAVSWGPDDALYVGTSNQDGRGTPGPQDDRILRVPLGALEAAIG